MVPPVSKQVQPVAPSTPPRCERPIATPCAPVRKRLTAEMRQQAREAEAREAEAVSCQGGHDEAAEGVQRDQPLWRRRAIRAGGLDGHLAE